MTEKLRSRLKEQSRIQDGYFERKQETRWTSKLTKKIKE